RNLDDNAVWGHLALVGSTRRRDQSRGKRQVLDSDREKAEAAAKDAIRRQRIDHARINRRTGQIPGSARDAFLVGDAPGVVSYHRWRCACRTPGADEISVG